ncbi:hypothetical protein XELAEV_18028209mg [Xenopus laevis]|uniref:Uncharacterized protein n=1 Tax=Xenopus laevis TaxID=8355 RepID=A0A974CWS7_XENLA|nr:hypothetical protein XELAEV_18028209mg [Xenopus laevis]
MINLKEQITLKVFMEAYHENITSTGLCNTELVGLLVGEYNALALLQTSLLRLSISLHETASAVKSFVSS